MQYKVVMYDDLLDVIRETVVDNGLTLVVHDCLHVASTPYDRINDRGAVHMNRDVYVFTFRLYHVESGEYLQIATPGDAVDEMDKGPGKALTYATKTAWEKVLMLARGDQADPDSRPSSSGARTSQPPRQEPRQEQQAPKPKVPSHDPATWPVPWPDKYAQDLEAYKDKEAVGRDEKFDWLNALKYQQKYTAEMKCPPEVSYWYIRGLMINLLATALETRHAYKTCLSIKANMGTLADAVGEDVARKIEAKVAEVQKSQQL